MKDCHPVLEELGLASETCENNVASRPSCLDLLNSLLEAKAISPEMLKSMYGKLNSTSNYAICCEENNATSPKKHEKKKAADNNSNETKNYRTRHVALQFYYDGSKYSGLAQNMGCDTDQSVEKALFAALTKTRLVESRATSGYSRCGRTDRGVSAAGQVVALQLKSSIPTDATSDEHGKCLIANDELPRNALEKAKVWVIPRKGNGPRIQKGLSEFDYAKMLNNVLPSTIRILGWSPVSQDFSARFSATTRTYRYFFVRRSLNIEKMSQALQMMVGRHDFRNFCKMDVEKVYNFERQIHSAKIVMPEESAGPLDVCYIEILGQAFLWHQIRCIASVLFLVGRELEEPLVVKDLLNVEKHPGKPCYPLAAEQPLVLHQCGYPNLEFGYSVKNLWSVTCHLEEQWEDLMLSAARVRNCIEGIKKFRVASQDAFDFVSHRLEERQKKQRKTKSTNECTESNMKELRSESLPMDTIMSWNNVLEWMQEYNLFPEPYCAREMVHIPLLKRGRGTTFEEKIEALQKSKKRKLKYEENVIKKRKSAEEDQAFYKHMTSQGGSGGV